jgi:hypothetical protein
LSTIRHCDRQRFGLTDNGRAKLKFCGCARDLRGSCAGA